MVINVSTVEEATITLETLLHFRGEEIIKKENLSNRKKFGNIRIFTKIGDIYHLKFSKKLFSPRENVVGGAADLDRKLKFAVDKFGDGDSTLNGIDEDLLVELITAQSVGGQTYFVTVMNDGRVLWRTGVESYEFILRYDTIMHFPKAFTSPVCFIPTGWLVNHSNVISALPAMI